MKKITVIVSVLLIFAMVLSVSGCGAKKDNAIVGIWEYADEENGMSAVYDLKDDGTGTYTMTVAEQKVEYELKYEVKDGHLLVRYVNNEIFAEDDVFDNEISFTDENTLIIKDTSGEELTFTRK